MTKPNKEMKIKELRKEIEEIVVAHKELGFLKCQENCVDQLLNLFTKTMGEEYQKLITEIEKIENPFEEIRKQANLQFHASECMKYLILGFVKEMGSKLK